MVCENYRILKKMKRSVLAGVFFVVIAFFAIGFIIKASLALFSYYQLSFQVPITITEWSIKEINSDQFAVIAHYSFNYQGVDYQSVSQVGDFYPNPWAANRAQKQYSTQKWMAWLNPKHPDQAILEKKFPYKKTISAGILIVLLIYFSILGAYVRIRHG